MKQVHLVSQPDIFLPDHTLAHRTLHTATSIRNQTPIARHRIPLTSRPYTARTTQCTRSSCSLSLVSPIPSQVHTHTPHIPPMHVNLPMQRVGATTARFIGLCVHWGCMRLRVSRAVTLPTSHSSGYFHVAPACASRSRVLGVALVRLPRTHSRPICMQLLKGAHSCAAATRSSHAAFAPVPALMCATASPLSMSTVRTQRSALNSHTYTRLYTQCPSCLL